ncbi:hypothetical protein [Paenibacillus hamazuiensis]|uniref:hypothetical protein n=1 Tax=Paenibacillus hamazuiensis TaxID=2936508 RepID=UPI00200CE6A5|nr:hypothetical protein [Paenibacillus hamazuiensis]
MRKWLLIIGVFMSAAACSTISTPPEPVAENRDNPNIKAGDFSIPASEQKQSFSAKIYVPGQVKANEEFVVEASLENLSDNDFTMAHAAKIFYFIIKDSSGKTVNTFVMPEVGITRPFPARAKFAETYTYKLEKPGHYEVTATAEFAIEDNRFQVKTNTAGFEVTR